LVPNNKAAETQARQITGDLILDCRELLTQFSGDVAFDSRVYLAISSRLLSEKPNQFPHFQEKFNALNQITEKEWLHPVRCLELLQDILAALKNNRLTLALTYFDADDLSSQNPAGLSLNQQLILEALNNLSGTDRYIFLKNRQLAKTLTGSNSR
jgi:hypothetical protein